jgi:hypothetical protein
MAEDLQDTLLLSFRSTQFDEGQDAFENRLSVYQDDAAARTSGISDATRLAAAQLAWVKYRAYSDMLEIVRDRLTSTQNDGEGQVSFTDVAARLKDIRQARDEALAAYQTASTEVPAAATRGSRSIPVTVEW